VSFHAHPDDEALLTGGTLARAATEGHRVVLVVATRGEHGLTGSGKGDLGVSRSLELTAAARELGCHRVVNLGYGDSGMHGEFDGFSAVNLDAAAERLATILLEEGADVLTTYDEAGGYGHPDHVQVCRVGQRAATLAGTRVVLQATVDRAALVRVIRLAKRLRLLPRALSVGAFENAYTEPAMITHRVDVRPELGHKRAAMAAHESQASGGSDVRTLALLLRLPRWLFGAACGREWFVQTGRAVDRQPSADIFDSLRDDHMRST
jgi:LmbE family N-acetylglucosaminyl deacetylase